MCDTFTLRNFCSHSVSQVFIWRIAFGACFLRVKGFSCSMISFTMNKAIDYVILEEEKILSDCLSPHPGDVNPLMNSCGIPGAESLVETNTGST